MNHTLNRLAFLALTLFLTIPLLSQSVEQTIRAVEDMIYSKGDAALNEFVQQYMVPMQAGASQDILLEKVREVRKAMHHLDDGVGVVPIEGGFRLMMSGNDKQREVDILVDAASYKIKELILKEAAAEINLTRENLNEEFKKFEDAGMAGVVYLLKDGEVWIKKAFGMANEEMGLPNKLNTIFGTGSRPIDYTVAAIQLLDQQRKLKISDPITAFIKNVPEDKKTITLQHLMTGRSGLPDFFDTEEDWDPDLQWVDRETAIRRMMDQELLFTPGEGREHSHGAFGLLAAIIEFVSGQSYYSFIREHFLDPAGMEHTGEYGETRGMPISAFAVGGGPDIVGVPNIPPNWGPTSWLIKGSGGMYSTLDDLMKFYDFIRNGDVLDDTHKRRFMNPTANLDGSMRGFELFSAYESPGNEVYLFLNNISDMGYAQRMMRALEKLTVQK